VERGGPPTPSSTCSLERKSSGWPALRQHRAIEGSGDKTRQICGRTLLCRFKCAASGRPNWALLDRGASTAGGNRLGDHRGARSSRVPRRRRGSLHSAFARDGRSCAPWPPAVLGAHGATTTSPVGRAKGGRSRWAAAFNRGRDVVPPWTPLTCPLGGERRSGADVEILRARPPSLPVDCRPDTGQICCGTVHAQDFDAAPFTWFPSRDSMLISVGSFSSLISAGMADLSRGKS
jgi:hypothetical protein